MKDYQREFIEFALDTGVLKFGSFTLKSGRQSPYFFNSGLFNSGASLAKLGRFYARTIAESGLDFDVLFGPAYKGIPLASTTVVALADQHDQDMPYVFNRKEVKDHGEGGQLVGAELKGKVLIIDDVISAGTSVRESVRDHPRRRRRTCWRYYCAGSTGTRSGRTVSHPGSTGRTRYPGPQHHLTQ